jgi:hypothetical protein
MWLPPIKTRCGSFGPDSVMGWSLGRFSSGSRIQNGEEKFRDSLAARFENTGRTWACAHKEERIRLPHFKSAGKSSENVCGVIVGEHFTFLSTINLTVIYYKILQFYLL